MSAPTWYDLLPDHEAIQAMSPEKLEAAAIAADSYNMNVSYGIAAIGNLLAGAALNEEQGLDADSVADLGWLLASLGELSAKLTDTGNGIRHRRSKQRRG